MSMEVRTNMAALKSLNILNKNSGKLTKSLKKVSSGMRIVGAADDTSGYAISERMRVMLRGLDQDIRNTQNGRSLLKVAAGGIDNIVEELRNLKELALNAANDHNTDADRATIQKEFEHKMVNINDIASETSYNGKILLDGRWKQNHVNVKPSASEPTGAITMISSGDYTISSNGRYMLAAGYQGRVTVTAENVELLQEDTSVALQNVQIWDSGVKDLWLNNLNICNVWNGPAIHFGSDDDNTLHLIGDNKIANDLPSPNNSSAAVIDSGGGLRITGDTLDISRTETGYGALIGSGYDGRSCGDITVGACTTIKMSNGSGTRHGWGAGIGSGGRSSCGDIIIESYAKIISDVSLSPAIGSGNTGGSCGDITIGSHAEITAQSHVAAAIGSGDNHSSCGDITISANADVSNVSSIGKGSGSTCGRINLSDTFDIPTDETFEELSLNIHHGTKAGQATRIHIEDMHTDAMKLSNVSVTTQSNANSALNRIDSAIEYALDQATSIGSIITRLEYTESNLTTASENTQASESTLRDADMAKEMVEYTKNNVLLQAAQSMLAQANQTSSSVLGLLQ